MSLITSNDIVDIEQLSKQGNSVDQIRKLTGRSNASVVSILSGRHALQVNGRLKTKKSVHLQTREAIASIVGEKSDTNVGRGNQFLPTPQQIDAACLAIREAWTDAERYTRHGFASQTEQEITPPSHEDRE
jgi:hypothetical protein